MGRPMAYSTIAGIQTANSRHMMGALAEMSARNLADKRARQARQHKARMAAEQRRTAPHVLGEPVRAADVPVTFKAEPKRRRVERPAKSIYEAATGQPAPVEAPEPAPEPVKAAPVTSGPEVIPFAPIKVADLPQALRDKAKRALQGEFCVEPATAGWLLVDTWEWDGVPVSVFVRKHGRSARYSVQAR